MHIVPSKLFSKLGVSAGAAALVPVGYIGSLALYCFADGADLLPTGARGTPLTWAYVAPADWYLGNEMPGANLCTEFLEKCASAGESLSDRTRRPRQ